MLVGILRDGRTSIPNNISHRIARRPGRRLRVNTRSLPIRRSQRQGHLRLGLVICSPRSLSEDKMQLAVDQFTCRIKVTGVGCGLRHDVEHDLAEAVEPPEAEEIGPPRWCCMKRASGDDPIGTLGVGPVPLKHFLDGLSVTYVPSIVGRAKNVFDCDLVPSYDRLEPEALNVERKVVLPSRCSSSPKEEPAAWGSSARISWTASRMCSRCRFSAPASTCSSADGSDGTRGTPSDLAQ